MDRNQSETGHDVATQYEPTGPEPSFDPATTSLDAISAALTTSQASVATNAATYGIAKEAYEARVAEAAERIVDPSPEDRLSESERAAVVRNNATLRERYASTEREALDAAGRSLTETTRQAVADAQAVVRANQSPEAMIRVSLTADEQRQAGERSVSIELACRHYPVEQIAAQMAEAIRANDRPAMSLFLVHSDSIPASVAAGSRDGTGRVLFGDDRRADDTRDQIRAHVRTMRGKLRDTRADATKKQAVEMLAAVRKAERPVVLTERAEAAKPGAKAFAFQQGNEVAW